MLNSHSQYRTADGSLSPMLAMRAAWLIWLGLGIVPALCGMYVLAFLALREPAVASNDHGEIWFMGVSFYLMLVVPTAFFVQSALFQRYYAGRPVSPRNYLLGMTAVWSAMAMGGVLSLIGCLESACLLPNLFPAGVAFMFFVSQFPDGRAMTHRVGASMDAAVYVAPR